MSIKFYTDTHIPKAVAVQLRRRGIEVIRCEEVHLAEADDVEHLEYATAHGLTMVSHDRDFSIIHAEWLFQGLNHTGIILFNRKFQANVGKMVTELEAFYDLIEGGAATLVQDIYNRLIEIEK